MEPTYIVIRGARQHNLKNINVSLPKNKLTVITGISGSGKSTLAFDTLYAEGQRRYVESLSAYARQFLERMEKPEVDVIEGLSPAIAIEQKTAGHNPRSTVGTVTEIYDYIRLLFAKIGTPYCYKCGKAIDSQTLDQMINRTLSLGTGTRIIISAPIVANQKGTHDKVLKRLKKEGFARVRINGDILEIDQFPKLDPIRKHSIDVIVDRLIINDTIRNRLADSLELALAQSDGLALVHSVTNDPTNPDAILIFSEKSSCTTCDISYPELTPAHFSFNSPHGACPKCDGLGSTVVFDANKMIPNPDLSLREGAVSLLADGHSDYFSDILEGLTRHLGVDMNTPYKDLADDFKCVLFYGSGEKEITPGFDTVNRRMYLHNQFEGLIPLLEKHYRESSSNQDREDLKRYMSFLSCPSCNGQRLSRVSRSVKIGDLNISEITAFPIEQAHNFFARLQLKGNNNIIAQPILKEIIQRLGFLENVGLSYLTLDRAAHTLSGGESQRIRLATQIGSKLTGVLYVLDEPSIGLHQRDNRRLLSTLMEMRDLGNTLLVVEHDEETIRSADHVVDMGPGAGAKGGEVIFSGSPEDLLQADNSLTGQYLSGIKQIQIPRRRRPGNGNDLKIEGAAENNLKTLDVTFPLGCLICVTGVSGSGKSTLILETLYRVLSQHLYRSRIAAGEYRTIHGIQHIDKVIHIDQSPIGKTPRSNPGTYTGVFTFIRDLFSKTPEARMRGYKTGRFSFNVKGGRCEACGGDGILRIEMHFLPDVYVTCDACRGRRYNRETLDIRYKGKNIAEVLDMTVNQAFGFFERIYTIRDKLETLIDVGLGYIRLGQPATTLSGGEAQRIKLSRELSKRATGKTVYILDEPTTGLHMDDIQKLILVLNRLVDMGNTVIVIEHHMDVIKTADHIIDLGPEGGDKGGYIVATGTPEKIIGVPESYTGQYLKKVLNTTR